MKLKTQDWRTLKLNRDFRLNIWTGHAVSENALSITLETEPVKVASKVRYTTDNGEWREQETFYQRRGTILDTVIGYSSPLPSVIRLPTLSTRYGKTAQELTRTPILCLKKNKIEKRKLFFFIG